MSTAFPRRRYYYSRFTFRRYNLFITLLKQGNYLNINRNNTVEPAKKRARNILVLLLCAGGLVGCSALDTTIVDPVEWWAVNGWGNAVTIKLYDNNCSRFLRDLKFRRDEEVKVVSCGDGQGKANVRFRKEDYASRSAPWSPDTSVSVNQRTIVR